MKVRLLGVGLLALAIAGCGSAPAAAPAAVTVTSAGPTMTVAATPTTVTDTVVTTKTAIETRTQRVTVTAPPTTTALRVSDAAACDLLFRNAGGEDSAISRLLDLVNGLGATMDQKEAERIATEATNISEELQRIAARVPADLEPYVQVHVRIADKIVAGVATGSISLDTTDTSDLRSAGYELTTRCGA